MAKFCSHFVRPKPLATLMTVLAVALCLAAGTWQVQRLLWKRGVIADIAAANQQPALTTLPNDTCELKALQFRRVALQGRWQHPTTEFHLAPRYYKNQFGYAVLSPFTLEDGRVVLVNRGWVPAEKKSLETRPQTTLPRGKVRVEGMLRVGAERSYFTPQNQPQKNIWFGRDVEAMAEASGIGAVVPAMVDAVGVQDSAHLPVPSDGTIRLRNDHLSYVITWYGLALAALVIFLLAHRNKNG